jgi:hypothetical protein
MNTKPISEANNVKINFYEIFSTFYFFSILTTLITIVIGSFAAIFIINLNFASISPSTPSSSLYSFSNPEDEEAYTSTCKSLQDDYLETSYGLTPEAQTAKKDEKQKKIDTCKADKLQKYLAQKTKNESEQNTKAEQNKKETIKLFQVAGGGTLVMIIIHFLTYPLILKYVKKFNK